MVRIFSLLTTTFFVFSKQISNWFCLEQEEDLRMKNRDSPINLLHELEMFSPNSLTTSFVLLSTRQETPPLEASPEVSTVVSTEVSPEVSIDVYTEVSESPPQSAKASSHSMSIDFLLNN